MTDPLGRQWTYGYTGPDLTLVTDPLGHKTSYAYGPGSTGGPLQANDLLTITSPNAQPGGPNAGAATVNVFDAAGRVTSQTDPMGHVTTFNYCVNAADGDCMNAATGTGAVTVTGPDGNTTVDAYTQGTLVAESVWTGTTLTSEHDYVPVTTAGGASGGTLLDAASTDGNGNLTTDTYDPAGNVITETSPSGVGGQSATTTQWSTALDQPACTATAQAASPCSATQTGPAPVAAGGVITPPSAAPPQGSPTRCMTPAATPCTRRRGCMSRAPAAPPTPTPPTPVQRKQRHAGRREHHLHGGAAVTVAAVRHDQR